MDRMMALVSLTMSEGASRYGRKTDSRCGFIIPKLCFITGFIHCVGWIAIVCLLYFILHRIALISRAGLYDLIWLVSETITD